MYFNTTALSIFLPFFYAQLFIFQATDAAVRDYFKDCGSITDVKLVVRGGKFIGCAFVGYQNTSEADAACESLNNAYFNSSKISVEPAKSFRKLYPENFFCGSYYSMLNCTSYEALNILSRNLIQYFHVH